LKVLHIYRQANNGEIGGVENHIAYLVKEQVSQGLFPYVLSIIVSNKDKLSVKIEDGVGWYYLEVKDPFFVLSKKIPIFEKGQLGLAMVLFTRIFQNFRLKQKLKVIEQIAPDIIHQHDYISSIRLNFKIAGKINVVWTNHSGEYLLLDKTKFTPYLQYHFLKPFTCIIAPSNNLLPHNRPHAYFIPNGADTSLFTTTLPKIKQELKNKEGINDRIVFLCARRWAPNKGVVYFAKALNLLDIETKQKAVFLFAGNESDDFKQCKKEIYEELNKCSDADIRILGNLGHDEMSRLFTITDVGVIPSLVEGMSLFSIELISAGIPVLATCVGGLPQIVKHEVNGWLVAPGSAYTLAKQIKKIVSGWPGTKPEIDTDEFRSRYAWNVIADEILKIYKKYI